MEKSVLSSACKNAEDALTVAESLSAQIERHRDALDHRSLFSAQFNRKLVRKIELLEAVRSIFLDIAAGFRHQEVCQEAADKALINGKRT